MSSTRYVTLPFDFEQLPPDRKASVVPICIERTDRDGAEIAWGWFEAVGRDSGLLPESGAVLARRHLARFGDRGSFDSHGLVPASLRLWAATGEPPSGGGEMDSPRSAGRAVGSTGAALSWA